MARVSGGAVFLLALGAALALASLHLARGADPEVRAFREETLTGLGARHVAVRQRWVAILVSRGRAHGITGDPTAALATVRKVLELDQGQAEAREAVGRFESAAY